MQSFLGDPGMKGLTILGIDPDLLSFQLSLLALVFMGNPKINGPGP